MPKAEIHAIFSQQIVILNSTKLTEEQKIDLIREGIERWLRENETKSNKEDKEGE